VVVTGYFGERLATMLERYGAIGANGSQADWGRAGDPAAVQRALDDGGGADIVALVHAETSTGVRNPVDAIAPMAAAHGALTIVDAVTSLGAMPVHVGAWGVDVCYSCSAEVARRRRLVSRPSIFSPRALARRACRAAASISISRCSRTTG
jgi:alanine-glyoxylate transaminase / serine-glyoxylate transaminase / serine-pyruvate transaminase